MGRTARCKGTRARRSRPKGMIRGSDARVKTDFRPSRIACSLNFMSYAMSAISVFAARRMRALVARSARPETFPSSPRPVRRAVGAVIGTLAAAIVRVSRISPARRRPFSKAMHTLLSTRLTRAARIAARPAQRHVARALRHHSARTRALAGQWRGAHPVDGIRTWFNAFFSALRARRSSHRLSLRTLLRKPAPLRAPSTRRIPAPHSTSRRPRRMGASSAGWFAFAAR